MKPFVANDLPGTRQLYLNADSTRTALHNLVAKHNPDDDESNQWLDTISEFCEWLRGEMEQKVEVRQQKINMLTSRATAGVQYEEDY